MKIQDFVRFSFYIGAPLAMALVAGIAIAEPQPREDDAKLKEQPRRDVQKRTRSDGVIRDLSAPAPVHLPQGGAPVYPDHFRTIDGTFNNVANPEWGAAHIDFKRTMPVGYDVAPGDIPARAGGPSARAVSNAICEQTAFPGNSKSASDYLWQWGQFLDHDINETPLQDPAEVLDIPVPLGDPFFDPMNTGTQVIGMNRSAWDLEGGMRQQVNEITSYIDASNVYGSDEARAQYLRRLDGSGKLKTSNGDLMPYNKETFPNAPTAHDPSMFLAGDVRANEQIGLTAIHTLFVREHNHWCDVIAGEEPGLTGDEIYERARGIVAAEMQAITYNEFLPLLLGDGALPAYAGYDAAVDASITNEFATAAFRVGHTMLSPAFKRLSATELPDVSGDLMLRDAFFTPGTFTNGVMDSILRGLAYNESQQIDHMVIDDVRNFLFGPPGSGGFDLVSLNVQRGRDHGLPDYNTMRVEMGLPAIAAFSDINPDPAVWGGFASVYSDVDEIDPWVGLLAEPHVTDALVGPTLYEILKDQFVRLRDGDRFWYETYMSPEMVDLVEAQTLAVIIKRNTGVGDELHDNVFIAQAPCPADLDNSGTVDFGDVSVLLTGFSEGSAMIDFAAPEGVIDFADVSAFLSLYAAGCP